MVSKWQSNAFLVLLCTSVLTTTANGIRSIFVGSLSQGNVPMYAFFLILYVLKTGVICRVSIAFFIPRLQDSFLNLSQSCPDIQNMQLK